MGGETFKWVQPGTTLVIYLLVHKRKKVNEIYLWPGDIEFSSTFCDSASKKVAFWEKTKKKFVFMKVIKAVIKNCLQVAEALPPNVQSILEVC